VLEDAKEPSYDIQAGSERADAYDQVLMHGNTFAVFDRHGDIPSDGLGEEGVYHRDTRHLSGLLLRLAGHPTLLLGSTARWDNSRLVFDLTNTDLEHGDERLPHSSVHVSRSKVLWDGACHERIVARSFARDPLRLLLTLSYQADFADIFEVRGMRRPNRGRRLPTIVSERGALLRYVALDGVVRRTRLAFSVRPKAIDGDQASFELDLADARPITIDVSIGCETGTGRRGSVRGFEAAAARALGHAARVTRGNATITSSNALFNAWIDRSTADLAMLTTRTGEGLFPYAGIPWFSTVFGRDAMVVAMQTLWVAPQIARGVLHHLATLQADRVDAVSDAEPGKILHEVRDGEMAALGEVPFARYYGSHDATPLFVMLAARYCRETDDAAAAAQLWPNVERALAWMDDYGDPDGDGFLEYARHDASGLVHQGWKDSNDSIFHADGSLARAPIATCEHQAYAFAARLGAAELAERLGRDRVAADLRARAAELQRRFDAAFWDEELGTFVLALDGEKRPCRVRTSNAGHALFSGIALPERAERVAATLMSDASFSGWGVRTVAAGEARYNPISYHNGSVWPHDNAMVSMGLSRYGHHAAAARILAAMLEASRHFELTRLPELFCGFARRPGAGATRYPVACSPQAWAAGSVFMLLQAALGLEIDAPAGKVRFNNPQLPEKLEAIQIRGLRAGAASLDLAIQRQGAGVAVRVLRRRGEVKVIGPGPGEPVHVGSSPRGRRSS
jgi:glycogen debranching enzyme